MIQDWKRYPTNRPHLVSILNHTTIRSEETSPCRTENTLGEPIVLVLVRLVDKILGIAIALEVIRDEIEVAMVDNTVDKRRELVGISEAVALDGIKDLTEIVIELEFTVAVVMTKVFDVLRKVTEEENVLLTNFSGDL